ncbi:hypothetical protein, partial [Streptomyces neyagawaensis]
PWTREGISFALRSGRLAGEWAVRIAEAHDAVAPPAPRGCAEGGPRERRGARRTADPLTRHSDLATRQVRLLSDAAWERPKKIRAERDPHGLFVGYLADERGALNANHWA